MARLQSEQEIEDILHLAMSRRGQTEDDLRRRLIETGQELGLSPDEIADAERAYYARKVEARLANRSTEAVPSHKAIHAVSLTWSVISGLSLFVFLGFLYELVRSHADQPVLMAITIALLTWLFGWLVYRVLEATRARHSS